jgi:DNA uptake protein ComE-like DNA-binding protein
MMRTTFHPGTQQGSVLIVTLWASIGLVSVALLFGHSMLMTYRGADNDLAGRQAEQAIDGAVRYAETLFVSPETPGAFPDITSYVAEAMPVGEATAWFLGRPADSANGTTREFGLVDEASKLNLNTATADMLRFLPGMTDELADAIVDWRDADDDVTGNGAESSTYLAQQPSYNCKNAPFESIEELAWVHGATRLILYGEDANMNGVLDPNEDDGTQSLPEDNADGKLDPGILEYVTVFSREPNKRQDGTARVNVSQMNNDVRTLLTDNFGDARAAEIMIRIGPSQTLRSPLEFYVRSGMTVDEFAKISDAITTRPGDFVPGLVNINTASETVLACIPGIGTEKAGTVLATRLSRSQQDTSIAWIVDILGEDGATQAGPYITGQSWQCSVDVAAVGRHGRGYRRARVVIDTTGEIPKIIYRRDLSSLGWALGSEVRQQAVWKEPR